MHRRFSRWCHGGISERVFEALTADPDNHYLMIDSTIVEAHQQAATGKGETCGVASTARAVTAPSSFTLGSIVP